MDNAIVIRDLTLKYRNSKSVALSIDALDIPRGQLLGVMGPSGSGKSTLLKAIIGVLKPTSGSIVATGCISTEGYTYRRKVSMIYQNFNLILRLDVLTNVMVGCLAKKQGLSRWWATFDKEDKHCALMALDRVGMLSFAYSEVRHLSGGQMQRVAIARCLAQGADIILADEPLAALDPVNARNVIELLVTLNEEQGITMLINLHQMDVVDRYCTAILGLSAGKVAFYETDLKPGSSQMVWQKLCG